MYKDFSTNNLYGFCFYETFLTPVLARASLKQKRLFEALCLFFIIENAKVAESWDSLFEYIYIYIYIFFLSQCRLSSHAFSGCTAKKLNLT